MDAIERVNILLQAKAIIVYIDSDVAMINIRLVNKINEDFSMYVKKMKRKT